MSQDTDQSQTGGNLPQKRSLLLIALGSNMPSDVGSPAETLKIAVTYLRENGGLIRAQSRFFGTPAFPAGSGPDYVNAAVAVEAGWSAVEAIAVLHTIEAKLGRRRSVRWGQRAVDLDLLAVDRLVRPNVATFRTWMDLPLDQQRDHAPGQLILPHPRMHERAFVLVPLAEVAPDWVHPVTRQSVVEMRDALPRAAITPVVPLD
ncbi:2-amino-4-hydroxy-6-hydroxymethyldihydropteridine diphosphokinase [Tateyamaria sp. SN3-11]|uniref:2-amino-4-hydroxy-6- hydroxymethyldihydropteridine diphosphokinase n=1 Tax=Tateyamaria sp. SN3-11 TaxID=3092147 RepID=UPI0039EB965F